MLRQPIAAIATDRQSPEGSPRRSICRSRRSPTLCRDRARDSAPWRSRRRDWSRPGPSAEAGKIATTSMTIEWARLITRQATARPVSAKVTYQRRSRRSISWPVQGRDERAQQRADEVKRAPAGVAKPKGFTDIRAENPDEKSLACAGGEGQEKAEGEQSAMTAGEGEIVDQEHGLAKVLFQRSLFFSMQS